MKLKIIPIALTSLLLGIGFNWLLFGHAPGLSMPLYTLAIVGITVYLAYEFHHRLAPSSYVLLGLALAFSLMVFIRASGFLQFFDIILTLYLLLLVVRLNSGPLPRLRDFGLGQYFDQHLRLPFRFLAEARRSLGEGFRSRATSGKSPQYVAVIRGLLISLPLLLLFSLLLSSADPVFKRSIDDIFRLHLDGQLVFRIILSLLVTCLFVGAYTLMYIRTRASAAPTTAELKPSSDQPVIAGRIEIYTILATIEALFLLFVLIQINYFFGGNHLVQSTGYTYAEYARKGFFELIAVAALSMLLLLALTKTIRRRSTSVPRPYLWLSSLLVGEVVIIIVSAHRRLSLYEQAYGFTILRLLSHLFIGWLIAAFALLLIHIFRREREQVLAFRLFVTVIAFFAILNLLNPEALIARQNINRFVRTGKIDEYFLTTLSEDAVPAISQLLNSSDNNVKRATANRLWYMRLDSQRTHNAWQSSNLAHWRAERIYTANHSALETNKDYFGTFTGPQPTD